MSFACNGLSRCFNIMLKLLNFFLGQASGRIDFSLPGSELLLMVYERLKIYAPSRPNQAESSMKLIQEDLIADELMPLAVTIIALKKASISAAYLHSQDFEQLCEKAVDTMATIHVASSSAFTAMMPKMPGLVVTAGHGKDEASERSANKIVGAVDRIFPSRTLRSNDLVIMDISNFMGEKLRVNRFDAKRLYDRF